MALMQNADPGPPSREAPAFHPGWSTCPASCPQLSCSDIPANDKHCDLHCKTFWSLDKIQSVLTWDKGTC